MCTRNKGFCPNCRNPMAKNFMAKLMLVMLDLAILNLILIEVQGNDPISISLSHSSIPITLYGPFKLDNVDGSYSTCLEERVKNVREL